jgi:FMN phosphatase YigB (HAD superfamily)
VILHKASQLTDLLARRLDTQVVSVDMFDTLVFRQTFDPIDAFHLQHARLRDAGLHAGEAASWVTLRKDHEHALARIAAPHEITLEQIYEALQTPLGWSPEQTDMAMALELEVEAELIRPYSDVVATLGELQRSGRTIIVQTDTYLPVDFIAGVLDRYLPFPYALRCSSQNGAPKRSGLAFARLTTDFGTSVVHLGDNRAVDVVLARKAGIQAHQVDWPRARALSGSLQRRYAHAIGARRVLTPWDDGPATSLSEIAFRWSFVLADFMLALRDHADATGATDIWLLSRDCESIAAVAQEVPEILGTRTVRYVDCSRSSCHPILAVTDSARFASWGYSVTEEATAAGTAAIAYYRAQLTPSSGKILLVDTGWKGRLQAAIASALPEVEVHGFYFSLEPGAEPEARAQAATFLPWEPRTFLQAVVEALAGFAASSCARFVVDAEGRAAPVRKPASPDRSPQAYCDALRAYMAVLLRGITPGGQTAPEERLAVRRAAVAQICAYPDASVLEAFRDWQIGIHAEDAEGAHLLATGASSKLDRILGREVRGNAWPRAAVWSVTSSPYLVRRIHRLQDGIQMAKASAKRMIGRSAV